MMDCACDFQGLLDVATVFAWLIVTAVGLVVAYCAIPLLLMLRDIF